MTGEAPADGRDESAPALDAMLDDIDLAVEPVSDTLSMNPSMGVAVTGGPMITLPPQEQPHLAVHRADSLRGGITQAGPVAVAGLIVNAASVVVVVLVARMVSARAYGTIALLLSLFFILSMPGSALLVGVVRRVSAWTAAGEAWRVHGWAVRIHRIGLIVLAGFALVVLALQDWIATELRLHNAAGVFWILTAAGFWILLCIDRGLMQAGRDYRSFSVNLTVEGGVRTVAVIGFVAAGLGVGGYAAGIFLGEVTAWAHARRVALRDWPVAPTDLPGHDLAETTAARQQRRHLWADVSAAFGGLALLAVLQNIDLLVLGRDDPAGSGSYAAISVASKALVFGALALAAYLLPEATIRWNEGGHALRQLGVTLLFLAVPAAVLLGVASVAPARFISLFFGAKLARAAPAFVWLVAAMVCLCVTVLETNYLFGAGRRWIVGLLALGAVAAAALVAAAHGRAVATAQADLGVQASLAVAMTVAFLAIHHVERRTRWWRRTRPGHPATQSSRPG